MPGKLKITLSSSCMSIELNILDDLQSLLEINISWCDSITENGVEALSRGCPKLRRFSSKGCKQVNNNAVICLATYCKLLTVLNLHSCDVSRRPCVSKLLI